MVASDWIAIESFSAGFIFALFVFFRGVLFSRFPALVHQTHNLVL